MKKNILIIIPYFVPAYSYGGPVKVAYDYAIGLIKKGHKVTVVTTDALNSENRIRKIEETIDGIKIYRFKNISNYLSKYHNLFLPIGFRKWIKKNIRDFDIVHMHDFFTYLNIASSYFCRKYNIRYYIQPHGSANYNQERGRSMIKKIFFILFGHALLKHSHGIIAVSESEKKDMYYLGDKGKISVIYNSIVFSELDFAIKNISNKQINDFLGKYNIENKKIILSLGRLNFVKRFDKLIQFIKSFLKNNKEYILLIVGPDEGEKENIQDIITKEGLGDSIVLTGGLYGDDKYIAYKISVLFSLLSDSEAGSITIIESIYFNLPILLSPGCHFEFIHDSIIVVDNKEQFEEGLQKLLSHEHIYDDKFKKRFDIHYLIDKLEKIYDNKR